MFNQAVAEMFVAADFVDDDFTASDLILQPLFTQLDVSDLSKAPPARDSLCCTGIGIQIDGQLHAEISKHGNNAEAIAGTFDHAVIFSLAGRHGDNLLIYRPRFNAMAAKHYHTTAS